MINITTETGQRPRVLVLLAAHNGAQWLPDQIATILGQLDVEIDLVVGDDASRDGTPALLAVAAATNKLKTAPTLEPTGSAAQNFLRLIRATPLDDHDFIAFADQDDLWLEKKTARACDVLTQRQADGYSSATLAFWENGEERYLGQSAAPTPSDFLFEGAGQGCTFVVTANFYRRLREFFIANEAASRTLHYHDWAIYALSRIWRLQWVFDPAALLRYRQHSGNDTGARSGIGGVRRRVRLIKRGWYKDQLRCIANLCCIAAPSLPIVDDWQQLLNLRPGPRRTARITLFCLRGGRRRAVDKAVLLASALLGWI